MELANQTLEKDYQNKLWDNAFKYFNKSKKQLQIINKDLCENIINQTKNIKLIKKTGSFRTMYRLEYLLFWYFENKIENTDSIKDKHNLKKLMRNTLKIINQELDNPTQTTYENNSENDSENQITSESDSENNHKDDETYIHSDSESSEDEDQDELIFQEFKTEVYNMTESQLNESLELRHLYPTGTKQEKITTLLDFGPTLPNNLSNYQIQRILNKYKINHKADSDSDSDYEPDDEKNNNTDSDNDEKNNNTDSDNDSDYEPYNHKKNNKTYSDYQSDSDSDSDYEPYNHKKQ